MGRPIAVRHVYALIRAAINGGYFGPSGPEGEAWFSEAQVSEFVPGSRTEIREALTRLTDEGVLHRAPRRGTHIEFAPVAWSLTRGLGRPDRHRVEVEELRTPRTIHPAPVLSAAFRRPLETLWQRDEVFDVDGARVCLRSSYWDRGAVGRPVILPHSEVDLASSVERAYGVRFGALDSAMSAVTADSRQSVVLEVPVGEPLLWRQTVITDHTGEVCEISHSFYVAARVFFELTDPQEDPIGV